MAKKTTVSTEITENSIRNASIETIIKWAKAYASCHKKNVTLKEFAAEIGIGDWNKSQIEEDGRMVMDPNYKLVTKVVSRLKAIVKQQNQELPKLRTKRGRKSSSLSAAESQSILSSLGLV